MPFNISSFKGNIEKDGYLKSSHYEVFVTPPSFLNQGTIRSAFSELRTSSISDSMRFRTRRITIPGINLKTINARRYGVGPLQKYPISSEFNETVMTILCDKNGGIWKFWYEWSKFIFDFNGVTDAQTGQTNRTPNYITAYKDVFSSTIIIVQYDNEGNRVMDYELIKSFPISVAEIPLDWTMGNLTQLNILINYKEHRMISTSFERNEQ